MTTHRDIESALRDDLTQVGGALVPDDGLPDRLIANATSGTRTVVRLHRVRRFVTPLLAAAACIVLVVGIVVANRLSADRQGPSVVPVVTTDMTTPAPTGGPTAGPPTASSGVAPTPPGAGNGIDWLRVLPASTGAPQGFSGVHTQFLDADTGFVLGDARCADRDADACPALIRTDDGGASWTPLTLPGGLSSVVTGSDCTNGVEATVNTCVNDVTFADVDHGYLSGPQRSYATSDAGRTWQLIPASGTVYNYGIVGDRALRVVVTSEVRPEVSEFGDQVLQSAAVGSIDFRPVTDDQFPNGAAFQIYPAGPVTYLVVDTPEPASAIFRTSDARTWTKVEPGPCNGRPGYAGLMPAADGSVFTDCGNGAESNLRLMTADNNSWTKVTGPEIDDSQITQLASASGADRLAVVVETDDLGVQQRLWVTTDDGGRTWSEPRDIGTAFPGTDLVHRTTSADGVFAVAGLGADLVSSGDGGKTWQQRAFG